MGRPPLPVGTHGHIKVVAIGEKKWEARGLFRDYDGVTRRYKAVATTKSGAGRTLEARFQAKSLAGATVAATARFSTVIHAWLAEVDETVTISTGTRRVYRSMALNHVEPALGGLFLREVTVPRIDECLRAVRDSSGRGAAKTTKTIISGILGMAVRNGAITANPAREAIKLPAAKKSATRALTEPEVELMVDQLRADQHAVTWDLPDLVEWMLYTGCRIGEALAMRDELNQGGEPLLDLNAGTWEVNATVIRVMGVKRRQELEAMQHRTWEQEEELAAIRLLAPGLHIQERTKTDAGWRVLALPPGAVEMIRRRRGEVRLSAPRGIVFGSPSKKALRDPSNTSADLRQVLDGLGCNVCLGTGREVAGRHQRCNAGPFAWVTSHTFRKTVATKLDQAGLSARAIADQLGHANPSLTQDVYMGRNVVNAAAAELLDR